MKIQSNYSLPGKPWKVNIPVLTDVARVNSPPFAISGETTCINMRIYLSLVGGQPLEHILTLQLQPGTHLVQQASLQPPDADITNVIASYSSHQLHQVVRATTCLY